MLEIARAFYMIPSLEQARAESRDGAILLEISRKQQVYPIVFLARPLVTGAVYKSPPSFPQTGKLQGLFLQQKQQVDGQTERGTTQIWSLKPWG